MVQTQYGTLITNIGLAKIANAQVTHSTVGLEYIALGDGNGAHYVPTQNQTALVNEVWRGPVAEVSIDPKNNNRIIIDAVIPVTVGGFTIREIGVFDDEGHLIAVGQYPEKYKPQLSEGVSEETIIHFVIETNNANVVKLNIDPTVIIASKDYVDKKFNNLDSRIGDTNKLETDYKSDTVGAINEVNDELSKLVENAGFKEPKSAVLERGANIVNAPIKTLSSVTALDGRTIVNLVPLFDSGLWTLHANVAMGTPKRIANTASVAAEYSQIDIPAKENTTYTLNAIKTGNAQVNVEFTNGSSNLGSSGNSTFTTPAGTKFVRIILKVLSGTVVFENISLNEGTEALPFVANVQGITNPTIENVRHNLIPAFNINTTAPDMPGWLYIGAINFENVDGTSTAGSNARVLLQVVPGTKYTFSCRRNAKVKITTNKGSNWDDAQLTTLFEESAVQDGHMSCTFTIPAGVNFITICFIHPGNGFVAYPMMVKGTIPAPYKAQVREALTLKTTMYARDQLKLDTAGRLTKKKVMNNIPDLSVLPFTHSNNATGFKQLKTNQLTGFKVGSGMVTKHNGAIVPQGTTLGTADTNALSADGFFYLSVANNNSGWGPNYIPTDAEIKAYFMGWAMYRYDVGGTSTNYDGAGTKAWVPLYNNRANNEGSGFTLTLPTEPIAISGKWQPYKFVYQLATPVIEVIETAGSLTLDEGENMLVVSDGRIVQEVVTPYYYYSSVAGTTYNRYEINTRTKSPLTHNTALFLQIYKNGKPDPMWTFEHVTSQGYTRAFLDASLFDPTAIYTVDYIPLDPFRVSAQTNPITIEYAENLGSVVQSLVTAAAEIGARMSNVENKQNFRFGKDEGGVFIIIDEEALT
ncbi:phage tail protein [Lysinibacillus xylanilyticus]|uniref:phage tail protein n=1 Tax=Lysinibacillus xylanilyticus TaxID=582475 RepID=UPI003D089DE5